MDVMKTIIGYERHKPFLGIFIFIMKLCCCDFLLNVFTKGLFLTSAIPTLSIFNGENCNCWPNENAESMMDKILAELC